MYVCVFLECVSAVVCCFHSIDMYLYEFIFMCVVCVWCVWCVCMCTYMCVCAYVHACMRACVCGGNGIFYIAWLPV